MTLTPHTVEIPRGARTGTLKKALANNDVVAKFGASTWGKKLAQRSTRADLTDFERFKLRKLKQQKRDILNKQVAKLKKAAY
jgi:large subunit ribosomal protein L14e